MTERDTGQHRFESGRDATQVIRIRPSLLPEPKPDELEGTVTVLSGPSPGATFGVSADGAVMGRSEEVEIFIDDPGLSRRHARIVRDGGEFFIEDLGSTNGTYTGGTPVEDLRPLEDGDRIQIGEATVLRFSLRDRLEQDAAERVYEMTVRDPLTRLHNRRFLEERLDSEFAYALRHGTGLSVLMIDVDHFKRINDTHGHQAGDAVLQNLANELARMVRTEDVLARYGGEEFVIVARGIEGESGVTFAERIRQNVEGLAIPWQGGQITIAISVGIAHTGGRGYASSPSLVAAADGALYVAKRNGRNRVEVAREHTRG